ncbi:MAG: protein NrdR [Microgenomates group bacterium GW2011_GWB1_45_17]|nr:MAG: protein NrdR [Microgenomates group bacterium GW2011_GWB1_45_17]
MLTNTTNSVSLNPCLLDLVYWSMSSATATRMRCPYCTHDETSVLESRIGSDQRSMRRRRQCTKCGKRFTTYERAEGIDLFVIKKNGEREPFDREKVKKGLMKATWKRPISMEEIEALIDGIEQKLRVKDSTEVKSWEIGKLVMNRLRKIDPVSISKPLKISVRKYTN